MSEIINTKVIKIKTTQEKVIGIIIEIHTKNLHEKIITMTIIKFLPIIKILTTETTNFMKKKIITKDCQTIKITVQVNKTQNKHTIQEIIEDNKKIANNQEINHIKSNTQENTNNFF